MEQTFTILLVLTAGLAAGAVIGYRQGRSTVSNLCIHADNSASGAEILDSDQSDLINHFNAPASLPQQMIPREEKQSYQPYHTLLPKPAESLEPPKDYVPKHADACDPYEEFGLDGAY
ncbi:hypothetical protein [Azomonas macrocytogenes]|nr:hypothetical protein [Azomonas macrocytogenes]